jgi:hypothetical protein
MASQKERFTNAMRIAKNPSNPPGALPRSRDNGVIAPHARYSLHTASWYVAPLPPTSPSLRTLHLPRLRLSAMPLPRLLRALRQLVVRGPTSPGARPPGVRSTPCLMRPTLRELRMSSVSTTHVSHWGTLSTEESPPRRARRAWQPFTWGTGEDDIRGPEPEPECWGHSWGSSTESSDDAPYIHDAPLTHDPSSRGKGPAQTTDVPSTTASTGFYDDKYIGGQRTMTAIHDPPSLDRDQQHPPSLDRDEPKRRKP